MNIRKFVLVAGLIGLLSPTAREIGKAAEYHFLKEIPIGGEGGWDYLTVDAGGRRLYVSHGAKGRYWKKIYGAAFLENLCQTLAQRVLVWLTHRIKQMTGLSLKLQVHDELVFVVKAAHAEILKQALEKIMVVGPPWAAGLPIAVEVGYADNYAEVK